MSTDTGPYGGGSPAGPKRVRVRHFSNAKQTGTKIIGLTSYDYTSARIFDEAGVDFLLVGDSAANVVYGYSTTLPVSEDELIALCSAVVRGAQRALVVADLPFGSYEAGPDQALRTAIRFMKQTGAHAVKLEGGERSAPLIKAIVQAGIPVMAHIGFTPQSEHGFGGHVIQGRGDEGVARLLRDAKAVEEAGAFSVVLEMVPSPAAAQVTETIGIATLSVGAGPHCDGQLLVWTDWAGYTGGRVPRFVKKYADLHGALTDAVASFRADVESGAYPGPEHEYQECP